MSGSEGPIELLQGAAAAILGGYLLYKIMNALSTGSLVDGPFSETYWLLSLMPWMLVLLGVVLLLSMFSEVFDL